MVHIKTSTQKPSYPNRLINAKYHLSVEKLSTEGKPPLARFLHSSCITEKYLIIYGGRNDDLFHLNYCSIALNDIHLLDIEKRAWRVLALFGAIPRSRWGASLSELNGKIYLFGGLSWYQYSSPLVYSFTLAEKEAERDGISFIGRELEEKDEVDSHILTTEKSEF